MELIKAIAKDQGFEIEIINPGFDAAISAVQAGQADGIIAGMSVTDARKATLTSQNHTTLPILSLVSKNQAPLLLMKI